MRFKGIIKVKLHIIPYTIFLLHPVEVRQVLIVYGHLYFPVDKFHFRLIVSKVEACPEDGMFVGHQRQRCCESFKVKNREPLMEKELIMIHPQPLFEQGSE